MPSHIPILAEPGELVIPRQIAADLIPQLQKALAKTNDDMEKFPGINGLDFRQYMVGSPEAQVDEESGMQMFALSPPSFPPALGPPETTRPDRIARGSNRGNRGDVTLGGEGYFSPSFGGEGDPGGPGGGYGPTGTNSPSSGVGGGSGGDEAPAGGDLVQELAAAASDKLQGYGGIGGSFQDIGFGGTDPSLVGADETGMLGGLLGKAGAFGAASSLIGALPGVERRVATGGLPGFSQYEAGQELPPPGAPAPVTAQGFARPGLLEAPSNFGFAGLDELQQRSRIASEGLYGNSLFRGDEAKNVFKNLLQRSLVGEGGQVGDLNSLLPVEKDYITQVLGLDISNIESLLRALG